MSTFMKMSSFIKYVLVFLIVAFAGVGCLEDNSPESRYDDGKQTFHTDELHEDYWVTLSNGRYCASIYYYNPRTKTKSHYTLTIVVFKGRLVEIEWPNGGWLDESHFDPPKFDDEGSCVFTSDTGYRYEVKIKEDGPCDPEEMDTDNDE